LFAMLSSLAGMIGNLGQAAYAYANRFMDAFAVARAAQVRAGARSGRTLSIAWPLWRDGGMRVDAATEAYLARTLGMRPLEAADAVRFFLSAVAHDAPVLGAMAGDLAAIDRALELGAGDPAEAAPGPVRSGASAILGVISELLEIPADELDPGASLRDLG